MATNGLLICNGCDNYDLTCKLACDTCHISLSYHNDIISINGNVYCIDCDLKVCDHSYGSRKPQYSRLGADSVKPINLNFAIQSDISNQFKYDTDHHSLDSGSERHEANVSDNSGSQYVNLNCDQVSRVDSYSVDKVNDINVNVLNNTLCVHKVNYNHKCSANNNMFKCSCQLPVCIYERNSVAPAQFQFGFIPITPLKGFSVTAFQNLPGDMLTLHNVLKTDTRPNCTGARIQVPSALNISAWKNYLVTYWDHQLVSLLACGFPLDLCKPEEWSIGLVDNHGTADAYTKHIAYYIETEKKLGAILGPFDTSPIPDLHCSPMMTRPKAGSDKRRVIIDLSWPHGHSVNNGVATDRYLETEFTLKFPSIDNIVQRIVDLKGDCLLFKIDLRRAFRQLKLDPRDIRHTGLAWNGKFYIDTSIPFGYRHGSLACQRVTDAIRYIVHKKGFRIFNYIDDFIGCESPALAKASFECLNALLGELGMPVSEDKLFEPQVEVPCLGIMVNVQTGIISIPEEKLHDIKRECTRWLSKDKATRKQLQSLLGSLLYVHKCVKPARMFVNRMLFTL